MRFVSDIQDIAPYVPGTPIERVMEREGLAYVVKLASNESPLPPFPGVQAAIAAALPTLNRYPDGDALELCAALARYYARPEEQVTVGNGSDDLLLLLGDVLLERGDQVVFADPPFMMYPIVAMRRGAEMVRVPLLDDFGHDLDAMAAAVGPRTKMVIVCNPNNPTGNYLSAADIAAFVDAVPEDVLVVVDEAYNEFVTEADSQDTLKLQADRPNVCLLRTFSKIYGLAGLRIGYGLCPASVKEAIDKARQPFNVNRLAQVAALAALECRDEMMERRQWSVDMRAYLQQAVEALGHRTVPSQTNFLLVSIDDLCRPANEVCRALQSLGAIVRDGYGLGCPGWARVTVGTRDEIDFFIERLASLERSPVR
jgi:histidinol-phosphate aminotransferase